MSDIIEALQNQDPGSELITLFVLDLGDSSAYFYSGGFTNEAATTRVQFRDATADENGIYQLRDYDVLPMEADGFDISSDGSYSRPLVSIANVSSVFSTSIGDIDYEDLIGKRLTRRTTLKNLLSSGSDSSPPIEYPKMVYIIDRIKDRNILTVTFELAAPYDLYGVTVPRRQIIAGSCPWKYQGASSHLSEPNKVGGCDWNKFGRHNVGAGVFTIYLNKEDEFIVPSDITGLSVFTGSATAGAYYKVAVAKTRINQNGTLTEESAAGGTVFDYWQCLTAGSTTPTDTNNNYRRVRVYDAYSASTLHKAYTDTGYNHYVTYTTAGDSYPQLWQVKTLSQEASTHNSTPIQNKYWTIGDRCGKAITSCMRRFQTIIDANDEGPQISSSLRNRSLPFGAFPGSRSFK